MNNIGHNKPPEVSALIDRLRDEFAELFAEAESAAFAGSNIPEKIKDEAANTKATDAVKRMGTALKAVEDARVLEKEPYLTASREVDGFFKEMKTVIDVAKRTAEDRIGVYLRAKAAEERRAQEEIERKAREEAERQRLAAEKARADKNADAEAAAIDEAAEAERQEQEAASRASASIADRSRSRTSSGNMSSLRTVWDFEIENVDAIPLDVLRPYLTRAVIEKAIGSYVRSGRRELKGVRIFETTKTSIR